MPVFPIGSEGDRDPGLGESIDVILGFRIRQQFLLSVGCDIALSEIRDQNGTFEVLLRFWLEKMPHLPSIIHVFSNNVRIDTIDSFFIGNFWPIHPSILMMRNTLLTLLAIAALPLSLRPAIRFVQDDGRTSSMKDRGKGIVITNASAINTDHLDFHRSSTTTARLFVSSRKKVDSWMPRSGETYLSSITPGSIERCSCGTRSLLRPAEFPTARGVGRLSRNGDQIFTPTTRSGDAAGRWPGPRPPEDLYRQARCAGMAGTSKNCPSIRTNIPASIRPCPGMAVASILPPICPAVMADMICGSSIARRKAGANPVNLGPMINSQGSEVFPFIHYSGCLYYSSDGGEERLGGLDIFFVECRNLPGSISTDLRFTFQFPVRRPGICPGR